MDTIIFLLIGCLFTTCTPLYAMDDGGEADQAKMIKTEKLMTAAKSAKEKIPEPPKTLGSKIKSYVKESLKYEVQPLIDIREKGLGGYMKDEFKEAKEKTKTEAQQAASPLKTLRSDIKEEKQAIKEEIQDLKQKSSDFMSTMKAKVSGKETDESKKTTEAQEEPVKKLDPRENIERAFEDAAKLREKAEFLPEDSPEKAQALEDADKAEKYAVKLKNEYEGKKEVKGYAVKAAITGGVGLASLGAALAQSKGPTAEQAAAQSAAAIEEYSGPTDTQADEIIIIETGDDAGALPDDESIEVEYVDISDNESYVPQEGEEIIEEYIE